MDALCVRCKEGICVWQGVKSDLLRHRCPTTEYSTRSVAELHQLMLHDDRVIVKAAVMREIGHRVVGSADETAKMDLFMLLYSYMKKYRVYEEVMEPAMYALCALMETCNGDKIINKCCGDMWVFLSHLRCEGSLRPIVLRIERMRAELGAADVLGELVTKSNGTVNT